MNKSVFRMPTPIKITGRSSSITNAFVNGIIPVIEPTDEQIDEVLETLGMNRECICCAYCGDTYTEWDHFRPLIVDKGPTGYISEIHNLVPACGKCNQSKGNKDLTKEEMSGINIDSMIFNICRTEWIICAINSVMEKVRAFHRMGELYYDILIGAYFSEEQKTDLELVEDLALERSTYYRRKKEAVILCGVLLWEEAKSGA